MSRPATANYNEKPDEDDDIMTIQEYLDSVASGGFIDDDGYGYPMKDGLMARPKGDFTPIYPSKPERIPLDATHIVWMNQ